MGRRSRSGSSVSSVDSLAPKDTKAHRSEKSKKKHDKKKDKRDKERRRDRAGSLSRSPDRPPNNAAEQAGTAAPAAAPLTGARLILAGPPPMMARFVGAPVLPLPGQEVEETSKAPAPVVNEPAATEVAPSVNLALSAQLEALRRQAAAAKALLEAAAASEAAATGTAVDDEGVDRPAGASGAAPATGGDDDDGISDDDEDDYLRCFDPAPAGAAADDDADDDECTAGFANLLNFARSVGGASRAVEAGEVPPPPKLSAVAGVADDDEDGGPKILDAVDDGISGAQAHAAHVAKIKLLKDFDHASYEYPPFKKDFFIPPRDVAKLSEAEIAELQQQLDGAKVTGKNVPPPIKSWVGIGLNAEAMDALKANGCECPFAVQSLAIPILMSGRDMLAIAKTGSGKTLAYLLPLLRQVHAQPRALPGDGPAGLILVPTHELAEQIFNVVKSLSQAMRLKVLPAYGGTALRECIGQCKGGVDVIVATPGRLFDLLVSNRGRVINLRRCTFVVIDEADRMMDEGFSGHVAAFLGQVRPDRQLAMVSSTMPAEVYKMAKKFLHKDYIELSVGGRPSPSSNVKQTVEFFDPLPDDADPITSVDPRHRRLLQILGDGGNKLVLVFVSAKELCDRLYVYLSDRGYRGKIAMLYSGMDQLDREYALKRFALGDATILVATAVAERGVDIHDLDLVVNYSTPDHYEAYVNRIGRTGRAGRKGRAITFMVRGSQDEAMAIDLVRGLESSGCDIPDELKTMSDMLRQKQKNGLVRHRSNYSRGFGKSKGYTFASNESKNEQKEVAKALGLADFMSDDDDDNLDYDSDDVGAVRKRRDPEIVIAPDDNAPPGAESSALTVVGSVANTASDRLAAARKLAATLTMAAEQEALDANAMKQARYDVNDFGQRIRKRIINRKYLDEISGETDTSITVKGVYKSRPGVMPDKEPLYLEIRGKESVNITRVFRKFDELIEEITEKANRSGDRGGGGGAGGRSGFDGKKAKV